MLLDPLEGINHLKIALEITPNLEPLFGTRDENLRLMEDSLGVRIDLRSDAVHVEGPDEGVARVRGIFQDFESLRRQGIHPHNGELNGMLRLVVAEPQPRCAAWWMRASSVRRASSAWCSRGA